MLGVAALAACRGDRGAPGLRIPGEMGGPHITVEVLNASGKPGLAKVATRLLRRAGIDVVAFGNAPETVGTLDSTRIAVRRGTSAVGDRVRSSAPTLRRASSSTRSWPHAALMSSPRLRRSTASTPCRLSRRSNASICARVLGVRSGAPPGWSGSRFTSAPSDRASCARRSACSSASFLPPMSTYSSVTRRRNPASARITSANPYFFSIGISSCRSSGVGACNETASRNCSGRRASCARPGRIPTVDTVMCRAPMPSPSG